MEASPTNDSLLSELNDVYRSSIIPGYAFIVAVIAYGVILEVIFLGGYSTDLDPRTHTMLRLLFLGICVAEYFISPVVLKAVLSKGAVPRGIQSKDLEFPRLLSLRTVAFVGYALSELPALFGFILAILSGQIVDYVIFLAVSLFFFYRHFPRYETFKRWALIYYP